MKRSKVYTNLSYFWLIMGLVNLMNFMSTTDLNVAAGFSCLASVGMFLFNSYMSSVFQKLEAAKKPSQE